MPKRSPRPAAALLRPHDQGLPRTGSLLQCHQPKTVDQTGLLGDQDECGGFHRAVTAGPPKEASKPISLSSGR